MISEEVIQRIKDEADIVDIISEKISLKRAGRNFIGRCPFHNENTPSFTVSPDKQIYKCFGCGEAGNVFSFVMKTENLTFPEVIKKLGEKLGIEVEEKGVINKEKKDKFERMKKLNVDAAKFFFANLRKNTKSMNYLRNRKIEDKTMNRFGLGFALDNWQDLRNYLKNKGYSDNEMEQLGLIIKSPKNNYYNRFRNRIIFPVFDHRGTVIGFGGRVLDDSKPKYLNSPETPLFYKGTNLYGLNFAIKDDFKKTIIMVEGYMDCIALYQEGIKGVVATLGTALTENQAKLLKRYADKVIIAYDADNAGQKATARGLEILKKVGLEVRVLSIPKGKDPDDFIKKYGKSAFEKLMDDALPLIEYRLKKAEEGINFSDNEMIIRYKNLAMKILQDVGEFERNIYIKQIAEKLHVKDEILNDEFNRINKKIQSNNVIDFDKFNKTSYIEPAIVKAERILLKYMLEDKEYFNKAKELLGNIGFSSEAHERIYELIVKFSNLNYDNKIQSIENNCNDSETTKQFINLLQCSIDKENCNIDKMIEDCIKNIKKYKLEESEKEVMNKIKHYEAQGNVEETLKYTQQFIEIQKTLKNLQ
ncbi:DNA primase [Clostridium sp. ATCC 25772]|uniref:DNA primase n=1 Tax=Clostridium sp. ATCC 25772 TaxID=1676991 RepID=UPI00078426E7|nr:DNA primase [Clostridium sp. ATCC 25772]